MRKRLTLDIAYFNDNEQATLRAISKKQYGKASISYLVRQHLKSLLEENQQLTTTIKPPILDQDRIELRLSTKDKKQFYDLAKSHHMTTNTFIAHIALNHLNKTPLLTAAEVEALYQSNSQLLRIGRNLNQITKQLNSLEGGSITSEQITALNNIIDVHTEKVGELLSANRRRNNE